MKNSIYVPINKGMDVVGVFFWVVIWVGISLGLLYLKRYQVVKGIQCSANKTNIIPSHMRVDIE